MNQNSGFPRRTLIVFSVERVMNIPHDQTIIRFKYNLSNILTNFDILLLYGAMHTLIINVY